MIRFRAKKRKRTPRCCGQKMTWKDSYQCYVCEVCGKVRELKHDNLRKELKQMESEE